MSMRDNQKDNENDSDSKSNNEEDDSYNNNENIPEETNEKNPKKRTISTHTQEPPKRPKKEDLTPKLESSVKNTSSDLESFNEPQTFAQQVSFIQKLLSDRFEDPSVTNKPDCTLQIRFPNGNTLKAGFPSTTPLKLILQYALVKGKINTKGKSFSLVTTFPRRQYSLKELSTLTLKDTDLIPRAVIVLEENFLS